MHLQRGLTARRTHCKRPGTHAQRFTVSGRRSQRAYNSSSSYPTGPARGTPQDMIGGLLDLCIVTCSQVSQSVVGSIADVVQSIAPPGASRDKVEVSVKGCLFLLVLGLLRGVLNVVLLVGSLGLAFYTVTQVFGCDAVVFRQGTNAASSSQQGHQQPQQQHHRGHHKYGQGQPVGQQQQQRQQQQAHEPWKPWPLAGQGDVVDVTRGKPL